MKIMGKLSIILLILLSILSCTGKDSGLTSSNISEVVEALASNRPLERYSLVKAGESVRREFREALAENISDNRDASACAMFSRIDEATTVTDEIVDGDYVVPLIWKKGGQEDGEELLRKVFRQDGDTLSWYQKTMEPYLSETEYRYSVTELSFNGDILPEVQSLLYEAGVELPEFGSLDTVSYGYNEITNRRNGLREINSPLAMLSFTLGETEQDEAEDYVSGISRRKGSSVSTRAGVLEGKLNLMLMEIR